MAHAWDEHYVGLTAPVPYGDDTSYERIADFVAGDGLVEDWGCGAGYLRNFIGAQPYRGIDGSRSPFADVVADLTEYRSDDAQSVVLRHVLEHSHAWATILDNAVASYRERLCVVLFTPLGTETQVLLTEPDYHDVPVIGFACNELLDRLPPCDVESFPSGSFYGHETIFTTR